MAMNMTVSSAATLMATSLVRIPLSPALWQQGDGPGIPCLVRGATARIDSELFSMLARLDYVAQGSEERVE
ncbi:hypothetical protein GCM10009563_07190 [Subtercola frigoramans]